MFLNLPRNYQHEHPETTADPNLTLPIHNKNLYTKLPPFPSPFQPHLTRSSPHSVLYEPPRWVSSTQLKKPTYDYASRVDTDELGWEGVMYDVAAEEVKEGDGIRDSSESARNCHCGWSAGRLRG